MDLISHDSYQPGARNITFVTPQGKSDHAMFEFEYIVNEEIIKEIEKNNLRKGETKRKP